jgi:rubrerythrin
MADDALKTLNDLIHLDNDAIQAYRQAIDACDTAEIRDQLRLFLTDHERHVQDLSEAVRRLGGQPVTGRDLKGVLIEGFTAAMSHGDRSALVAMRGNEELTTRRYDAARRAAIAGDPLMIVERNFADEQRHLAWIKDAIDRKIWERKAA